NIRLSEPIEIERLDVLVDESYLVFPRSKRGQQGQGCHRQVGPLYQQGKGVLHSPVGDLETGIDDGNFGHLGSFLASEIHRQRASWAYGEDGRNALETNYLQKRSVLHK